MDTPESYFEVQVVTDDLAPRVVVSGELDAASSKELERALTTARASSPAVTLDLGAVSFIDSSGLRVITSVVRDVEAAGADFSIDAASEAVRRIFEITGLGALLPAR